MGVGATVHAARSSTHGILKLRLRPRDAVLLLALSGCVAKTPTGPGAVSIAPADDVENMQQGKGERHPRLSQAIRPTHYELKLDIDPKAVSYAGEVRIRVALDEEVESITLHSKGLRIETAELVRGRRRELLRAEQARGSDLLRLRAKTPFSRGQVEVRLVFRAAYQRDLSGVYKTFGENKQPFVVTQFEPVSARAAFPCFDEPSFKAPLSLSLVVPKGQKAFGNAPQDKAESLGDKVRYSFRTTRPLPTYLIAFAVGPWHVARTAKGAVPLRILSTGGQDADFDYAKKRTQRFIKALEAYFGSTLPFPKVDLVAVPDFGAAAMENPGLITFSESLLRVDEKTSTESKTMLDYVILHELAHQWFGNLVTPAYWDELWLNEAFATWLGYKILEQQSPPLPIPPRRREAIEWAMQVDSHISARKVREPITSDHDIENAFDPITYEKGSAVLGMVEQWLGPDVFQKGVRLFVNRNADGAATTASFVASLEEASGQAQVSRVFETMLDRPGLPYLRLALSCGDGKPFLSVKQERFLVGVSSQSSSGPKSRQTMRAHKQSEPLLSPWALPVCVRIEKGGKGETVCTLIDTNPARIEIPSGTCPDWVMPNAKGRGYYRLALPQQERVALRTKAWPSLDATERMALLDSMKAAYDLDELSTTQFARWVALAAEDSSSRVTRTAVAFFSFATDHLVPRDKRSRVQERGRALFEQSRKRVLAFLKKPRTLPKSGEARAALLDLIHFLADTLDDKDVRAALLPMGLVFLEERPEKAAGYNPELAPLYTVAGALALASRDDLCDQGFDALRSANSTLRRKRVLRALGHARGACAGKVRRLVLGDTLPVQDRFLPLSVQMSEPALRDETWTFVTEHLDDISRSLGPALSADLPWLAAYFCDEAHAKRSEELLGPYIDAFPGGPKNLETASEGIRSCSRRVAMHKQDALTWLERQP